jgi:serine protease Do
MKSKIKNALPKMPKANKIFVTRASLAVFIIMSGFIGGWFGAIGYLKSQDASNTKAQQQVVLKESELISSIAKDVSPSVVSIDVTSSGVQQDFFFGRRRQVEQQSAGTGFILNKEGLILTNRHVIPDGTTNVSVTLSDGTSFDGVEVIGKTNANDTLDVAFLKIKDLKGKQLQEIRVGDSSKVQVGDKAIAIGNALGQFQNTVTAGIISGYGRNIQAADETGSEPLQNLFQTDAAINQGNSGGPLVNINGEVIGINTAVASGGTENIGFAIPINDVKGLISGVSSTGKLSRPYLGVRYVTLTDEYAYIYNLNVKRGAYLAPNEDGQGVVLSGSPAEKAGLKEKDIITHVDGTAIDERNSLTSLIGQKAVGAKVPLKIVREGKEQIVEVTLEAMPNQ